MRLSEPGDEGSVLALVPAAFLVLILLAALAVDSAVAFQAHEQLHDAVIGAANDAVTAGLDQQAFYSSGAIRLDPQAVEQSVCASMAAEELGSFRDLSVGVSVSGEYVRVTARGAVEAVFGRAIPGFGQRWVSATADADVQTAAATGPVPDFPASSLVTC